MSRRDLRQETIHFLSIQISPIGLSMYKSDLYMMKDEIMLRFVIFKCLDKLDNRFEVLTSPICSLMIVLSFLQVIPMYVLSQRCTSLHKKCSSKFRLEVIYRNHDLFS